MQSEVILNQRRFYPSEPGHMPGLNPYFLYHYKVNVPMTLAVHSGTYRKKRRGQLEWKLAVTACFPPLFMDKTVGNSNDTILKTLRTSPYGSGCHYFFNLFLIFSILL